MQTRLYFTVILLTLCELVYSFPQNETDSLKVFQENEFISFQEIISFLNNNKEILKINSEFLFNEGYLESVRDED